jgi:branched-chain amino acid transport system substrate-binding protein
MQRRALLSTISTALFMPMISRHASAAQAPGVTATEIKVGNTMPYSGPGSTYGTQGKAEAAYFRMINEQGGVNGRTVNFISLDDQSSPSKALEQARRLIEQEEVALLFSTLGTQQNSAMVKYVNQKKVPHLFLTSGANKWGDYAEHPWTMGWAPSFRAEAKTYAKYIQRAKPDGKIGIIYENDDLGKDYVAGIRDVIGEAAMKNVSTVTSVRLKVE